MAFSREYLDFVLEQLAPAGLVETKRLFGGMGLYWNEAIFGFVTDDTLYLKVDEATQPEFEARGSTQFAPPGAERMRKGMPYMTVPEDVMEDRDELTAWARRAMETGSISKKR